MLIRWEALQSAGFMDERFFLYCEETDLCLRIKQAGWEIRHVPYLTILHHADKAGWNPRLDAQAAFAKRQYFDKHLSPVHRLSATAALVLGYTLRSVLGGEIQGARKAPVPHSPPFLGSVRRPSVSHPGGIGRRLQALRPGLAPYENRILAAVIRAAVPETSVYEDVGKAAT